MNTGLGVCRSFSVTGMQAAASAEPVRELTIFDEDYLTRLRNGDDDTARHFDRHFRRLLHVKLWRKFTAQREQELIEDVLGVAVENILRGEPKDATRLPAYVCGICSNLTKKEMRPRPNGIPADIDIDRLSDQGQTVEERLLERETAKAVAEVLETLSWRDRNLLKDLFYNELSRDEVCEKYGVTRDQLRLVLYHARRRFQKKWPRPV